MIPLRLLLIGCFALYFFGFLISPLRGESESAFRAGAATADITPKEGVSLDGPISKNGPVTGVHDRLHARALVLDDGKTRLAIVICDACMIGREVFDAAKKMVQDETGFAADRMLMAATHTHAAVRAVHIGTEPADDEYHRLLARRIADAVIQAEKNFAPARVGFGSFDKPDFVRCRRFLCEPGSVGVNPFGEAGERIKSVAGRSSAVIEPAGPVDPQFSLLSVQHADGKPLAVLGNFSVHYCGGYQRGLVSADYFGHYAAALESQLDAGEGRPVFVGLMSNGTSGNTGSIERGGKQYRPFEWMKVSARILAEETLKVIGRIEHRSDMSLGGKEVELTLAVRRPDQKRLKWAKDVLANPDGSHPHRWSKVYAQETLHLSKYTATKTLKLQALRIGDVAIAAMPCEVFAETGLAIKKDSPHRFTFSIQLANGYGGYLPTREQHELGGYETWPARSSFLEVDAESKIRAEVLRVLSLSRVSSDENQQSRPEEAKAKTARLVYKKEPRRTMTIYYPDGWKSSDKRPALVIFRYNIPYQREHFRKLGMVIIKPQTAPVNSGKLPGLSLEEIAKSPRPRHQVEDTKSAIRFIRKNADKLGIDPTKIVATGTSGGGDLALQSSINRAFVDTQDDQSISPRANALVLYCPAFDGIDIWFVKMEELLRRTKSEARSFLPLLDKFIKNTTDEYAVPRDHRANLIKLAAALGKENGISENEIKSFQEVLLLFNERDWQLLHPVGDALKMSTSRILTKEPLPPTLILLGDRDHLYKHQTAFVETTRSEV